MAVTSQSTLKELVDETRVIKNELVSCRNNLKINLRNKGVDTTGLNKMGDLVNSIPTMPAKRFASGCYSDDIIVTGPGEAFGFKYTRISTGLDFVPKYLFVKFSEIDVGFTDSWDNSYHKATNPIVSNLCTFNLYGRNKYAAIKLEDINKYDFTIVTSTYNYNSTNVCFKGAFYWYAFE